MIWKNIVAWWTKVTNRSWLQSYIQICHFLHIREDLEPWFVGEVTIEGDTKLLFVIASGLPTTEDFEHVTYLEILKAPPIPIGIA
ncbi:hypothetical protein CFC21_017468 [Triticum aestivum]|uniref:Uncharacterized protein n=3 Tax=Triticum TaxID=4564 RepID=A0A9R1NX27_TRITD|nr:hypothetical protein CFC21_017468 [Triticum aestivum]VAH32678.1 unnamed protein product [Triticum turgidum subsp. durum]